MKLDFTFRNFLSTRNPRQNQSGGTNTQNESIKLDEFFRQASQHIRITDSNGNDFGDTLPQNLTDAEEAEYNDLMTTTNSLSADDVNKLRDLSKRKIEHLNLSMSTVSALIQDASELQDQLSSLEQQKNALTQQLSLIDSSTKAAIGKVIKFSVQNPKKSVQSALSSSFLLCLVLAKNVNPILSPIFVIFGCFNLIDKLEERPTVDLQDRSYFIKIMNGIVFSCIAYAVLHSFAPSLMNMILTSDFSKSIASNISSLTSGTSDSLYASYSNMFRQASSGISSITRLDSTTCNSLIGGAMAVLLHAELREGAKEYVQAARSTFSRA